MQLWEAIITQESISTLSKTLYHEGMLMEMFRDTPSDCFHLHHLIQMQLKKTIRNILS